MLEKVISALVITVLLPISVKAAELKADVSNKKIAYGETVELRLSYDGSDLQDIQPDLSVLQKDFAVYSTSSSMNTSIINGNMSQKKEWIITLLPANEGNVTIPAISAGNYSSNPISIEVLSAEEAVKTQNNAGNKNNTAQVAGFSANIELENNNPYIEQEILATLTVKDNRNLQFESLPYFENNDDWIIKSIGRPQRTQNDGWQTTTFVYALSPQKSGKLELPSATIKGYYVTYESSGHRNLENGLLQFFDVDMSGMFGVKKPVMLRTKPQIVNIKPIPSEYKSTWWVPADVLIATAEWVDENPKFKVGETVAREITITASGVTENKLPEIEFKDNSLWKQYPDKPQYSSTVHENKIISQEIVRVVYIPQKSGKLTLPEIIIPWFNVKTQKTETAIIPSQEIEVENNVTYQNLSQAQEKTILPVENNKETVSVAPKTNAENTKTDNKLMIFAILIAFFSGLLISFLLFGRKEKKQVTVKKSDYLKTAERAMSVGDYRALRDALLHWGQEVYSHAKINNLKDLSDIIKSEELAKQLDVLNAILYGKTTQKFDMKVVADILKKSDKSKQKSVEQPLPNLYK